MNKLVTTVKEGAGAALTGLSLATTELFTAMYAPVHAEGDGIFDVIKTDGTPSEASSSTDVGSAGQQVGDIATKIYWIIVGVAVTICLMFFVFKAVKLAKSGDNPSERSKAVGGLITAIIAVALIGSAATIAGWAFGIF